VTKPEKLYASFRDVGIHPLGERLTPDGLGDQCARWLDLWMKNKYYHSKHNIYDMNVQMHDMN
jgi:hypothetical protein